MSKMKAEGIVEIVKREWIKQRNSPEIGRWRRITDAVISQLNVTLPVSCPFCNQQFRTKTFFIHFEDHLFRIIQHFEDPEHIRPLLGYCVDCGKFVISPSSGVAYTSLRHLKRDGFTGDVSGSGYCEHHKRFEAGGLYCTECMKRAGWQWGEKEVEEYE